MSSNHRIFANSAPAAVLIAAFAASPSAAQAPKATATRPATSATAANTARPVQTTPEAKLVSALAALPAEKAKDPAAVEAVALSTLGRKTTGDGLFLLLMEYQKLMEKEARADAKLVRDDSKLELELKTAKLSEQNAAIDQGMREAREKADIAMTAAWTGLTIGIAQGLVQIGAAAASYAGQSSSAQRSDVELVAVASRSVESALPAPALEIIRSRVEEVLKRATKAQETKASITAAYASVFASDPVVASQDRGKVLLVAAYLAHQKALNDLKTAIEAGKPRGPGSPYDVALRRARMSLDLIRLLARKLR